MQYINSELGIRVKQDFADMKYMNAGGRGWYKVKLGLVATLSAPVAAYMALSNSDKSRYKTVMGSISNPPSHLIKEYYNNTKRDFPFDANMSSEQLQTLVEKLTNEYNRWGTDADTKAAIVARNRKQLDKGDNKQIIAQIAAIRSWMQAINDYRAEVVKAYDKAFAREEKAAADAAAAAEKAAAEKAAASTTMTQNTSAGAALSPIGEAQGQAGSGGIVTGPISEAIKGDVKVGGTQVKKSYLVFGGLALGVLGFLYFRNK